MFSSAILTTCLTAALAVAAPTGLHSRATCPSQSGDAPYSTSCDAYTSAVTCPQGIQGKAGGIVFLVHGTGSTGPESWDSGPYTQILPNKGVGYDVCYVTMPGRTIGDAQISSEYVAYNTANLANQSATGKVFLIGHSQGNLNIQWALDFWPSIRSKVLGFTSLAGDFHGTDEGALSCTQDNLLNGGKGCPPSVWQQSTGSHFLGALNSKANQPLVPTTSVYTLTDDIIQPEIVNPTSVVPGAANYAVQDLRICGPAYVADHFTMITNAPGFYLAYDALTHGGQGDASRFAPADCTFLQDTNVSDPFGNAATTVRNTFGQLASAIADANALSTTTNVVTAEPLLMPYVCARGDATSYCA